MLSLWANWLQLNSQLNSWSLSFDLYCTCTWRTVVYILMNKCVERVLLKLTFHAVSGVCHSWTENKCDWSYPFTRSITLWFNSLLPQFSVKTNWMRLFRWVIHWVCTGATFDDKLCISDHISNWLCLHKCSNRKTRFSRISATSSSREKSHWQHLENLIHQMCLLLGYVSVIWYDMIWYDMICIISSPLKV